MRRAAAASVPLWFVSLLAPAAAVGAQTEVDADLPRTVVRAHAAWCRDLYADCEQRAQRLAAAVDTMLAKPDAKTLAAARAAWCDARASYCRSEVLRFQGGPIEPLEPFLNAWPVDEAYIDAVAGDPDAGIVNDTKHFPSLGDAVLRLANERGGEANICTGWHAIEFELWGQDLRADGPGDRPASDFVPGVGRNAERRATYLRTICALLVKDLATVRAAWEPQAKHRQAFERDPDAAVRAMLTGACVLSAFELAGERLAVALETRDQEQEHSCFSDTTCADLVADQCGIVDVMRGRSTVPGVLALVRARDPALGALADERLTATSRAMQAIPQPFDQAMLGADGAPGRAAIRTAVEALEQQAEVLVLIGVRFGYELPLKPGN